MTESNTSFVLVSNFENNHEQIIFPEELGTHPLNHRLDKLGSVELGVPQLGLDDLLGRSGNKDRTRLALRAMAVSWDPPIAQVKEVLPTQSEALASCSSSLGRVVATLYTQVSTVEPKTGSVFPRQFKERCTYLQHQLQQKPHLATKGAVNMKRRDILQKLTESHSFFCPDEYRVAK